MIVDASVWVSAFLPADAHHGEVLAFLRRAFERGESDRAAQSLPWPRSVAPSRGEPATRRCAAGAAQRWCEGGQLLTIHALDDSLGEAAARLAIDAGLRGADAVCVALAARLDATLVTLDREMMERGAATARIAMPDAA
ncbi:MAG: PIN domain-containing protein [Comamonadaceae bacterium]|nr:PIN domain-containing protein [Comamonadaceae bacterium]